MASFNLFDEPTEHGPDPDHPAGYRRRTTQVGPKLGAQGLGLSVYDLPPGEAVCPYHFHWTDEEWLLVVTGRATLRTPDGERVLAPGELVCFPAGPDGAHQVRNASDAEVRVALFSMKHDVGVAEYPDSDKVAFWSRSGGAYRLVRRSPQLDYWDGEL